MLGQLLITFDDVPNSINASTPIPNGYSGLNWKNALVLNTTAYPQYSQTGFYSVLKSGKFVASNSYQKSMSISTSSFFNLNSLAAAATWLDNSTLTILGERSSTTVYSITITLRMQTSSLVSLNWANVDTLVFTTSGSQFAMDNLCMTK
ncbi:unnamed protein product [Didymodactylos carnosus]|uniref:Uncharacterized protein n=1 Tax=Didymodactylos carnosus TaxID=1234261 RepID=A0A8S2I6L5_9BILA|nr:unnamed protein product [Didymodactylos carnosus]CAF3718583.1 unnamed protein product [Didymodactylos carnosus]